MKLNLKNIWLSIISFFFLSSCGVTETPKSESFYLYTKSFRAGLVYEVTYTADVEGDAKIDSLSYSSSEVQEIVHNPILPWNKVVTINRGFTFGFSCGGKINQGKVKLKVLAISIDSERRDTLTDFIEKIKN